MVGIGEFFSGESVFITGATGFVGKALLEKLLRSCPDVGRVYLLIRSKGVVTGKERLHKLVNNDKAFTWLKTNQPQIFCKLVAVNGDVTKPELGISPIDKDFLRQHVSIVFNSAARLKFDDKLKDAIEPNVLGPQRLVDLCRSFRNLKVIVHASTAYCNTNERDVYETIYRLPVKSAVDFFKLIEVVEDDTVLLQMLKPFIGDCPNVYSFTKGLAEQILEEKCSTYGMNLVIVRPSIISAAIREPAPGWIDGFHGTGGLTVGVGKGLVRVLLADPSLIADVVPVDCVVNLMISAAWERALDKSVGNGVRVYNCTTSCLNPITWGKFCKIGLPYWLKNPPSQMFWHPSLAISRSHTFYKVATLFLHRIPAYCFDMITKLSGKKPIMVKLYEKIDRAMSALEYYLTNEWRFHSDHPIQLLKKMTQSDKEAFQFDVRSLNWESYMESLILGARYYLMRDDFSTVEAARNSIKQRQIISWVLLLFFAGLLLILVIPVIFHSFLKDFLY